MSTKPQTANGRPCVDGRDTARDVLLEQLTKTKKTLVGLLQSASRDYEVMADLLTEANNLQMAADQLVGQS